MLPILLGITLLLPITVLGGQRIRTVELKKDEIVMVKTALSVATIVQVPDRPLSVVVGDAEAFKVEYLDQAITIKPLHSRAKSNLYVYTDYRRYDVSLVTTVEAVADYVVYLKPKVEPSKKSDAILWSKFDRSFKHGGYVVSIKRLGLNRTSAFIDFAMSSSNPLKIDPASFWLTQSAKLVPIEKLILSELDLKPNRIVVGMIEVNLSHLNQAASVRFELRGKKTNGLDLPQVRKWK